MGVLKSSVFWVWWLSLIFLLLRVLVAETGFSSVRHIEAVSKIQRHNSVSSEPVLFSQLKYGWIGRANETAKVTKRTSYLPKPKSPKELDMPECLDDSECTFDSVCVPGPDGYRTCICAGACPPSVPVSCRSEGKYADDYCLSMSDDYREKYLMPRPICKTGVCVCPPMFDNWLGFEGFVSLLPIKCSKRDLRVQGFAYPSDTVYVGGNVKLFCCINIDPRSFVNEDGIRFIHNSSIVRRSSSTPFSNGFMDGVEPSRCWRLDIKNVQLLDAGPYTCCANVVRTASTRSIEANDTFVLTVKARLLHGKVLDSLYHPSNRFSRSVGFNQFHHHRVLPLFRRHAGSNSTFSLIATRTEKLRLIQHLKVEPNATCAKIIWEQEKEIVSHVQLSLVRQSLSGDVEVWKDLYATSGIVVCDLSPDTLYALKISAVGWENDTMNNTVHFFTLESEPGPPTPGTISLSQSGSLRFCHLHWTPPKLKNGRITKYYVSLRGSVRSSPPGILIGNDFPVAQEVACANDGGKFMRPINAELFSDTYLCKFGPLKPNRNYTAAVWAENKAGRSSSATFSGSCVTPYGKPDNVVAPTVSSGNTTSFELKFDQEQDEANGPIVCFYLAIVPLLESVSIESLPQPDALPYDMFGQAMSNNIDCSQKQVYFAYIAESYAKYPSSTIVGDGNPSADIEPCRVPYLSRYRAEDMPLRPHVKYTGFLIARVERNNEEQKNTTKPLPRMDERKKRKLRKRVKRYSSFLYRSAEKVLSVPRTSHISNSLKPLFSYGPEYAYSAYFKPIILKSDVGKTGLSFWVACAVLVVVFFMLSVTSGVLVLYRHGFISGVFAKKEDPLYVHFRRSFGSVPIPVGDLLKAYRLRSRDSDMGFDREFEALPRTERFHKACASKLPENRDKNRYSDKHTFDETRVKLKHANGSSASDYINANYINGYKNKKRFIATQGPKDSTQSDFWQMVWQQDARIIVMITKLQEGSQRQCSQYWPDRETSKSYGDYEVRHITENICTDYVIREFEIYPAKRISTNGCLNGHSAVVTYVSEHENGFLVEPTTVTVTRPPSEHGSEKSTKINVNYENIRSTKSSQGNSYQRLSATALESNEEPRKIVQYHFTSWPDFGTPKCTTSFLRFVLKLRTLEEFNTRLVVVHCSAGCGRTGTFIAIDSLLDQCMEKNKADIFGFVSHLREARGGMIQNAAQYRFIYRALTTWYLYGNTDVEERSFRDHYTRLLQPSEERRQSNTLSSAVVAAFFKSGSEPQEDNNPHDGKSTTRIEEEFKRLQIFLDPSPRISFAYEPHNAVKNRFEDAVPYDYCRVILPIRMRCTEDTTYINASQFKGHYFNFILAQDPVNESTCYDFWQMIDKFRSKIIVMLSNDNEFAVNERYWPNEVGKSISFGSDDEVSVKLVEESLANEAKPTYILRKITYKFAQEKFFHEVTQFDYLCWPKGRSVPTSMKSLISLIDLVLESQISHDKDVFMSPIVLHSRDGSSETGIFCCVTLLLERLRCEQSVDVFQTVRSLQRCRPRIITSLEQYKFCYEAVLEYLDNKRIPSR